MLSTITNALAAYYDAHPILVCAEAAAALLAIAFFAIAEIFKPAGKRRMQDGTSSKLPPGPRGLPLLGSIPFFIRGYQDHSYTFLSSLPSTYGEMATLHLGEKTWVLLNSHRVVQELIVKRGSATNTRSHMPVASGIASRGMRSLLMPQEQWAEPRRVMHHLLSGSALTQYGVWQEKESTQMMAEYVLRPQKWYSHHYRYANSVVHQITLGERTTRTTQELIDMQNCATRFVRSIGKSLVDWFPTLETVLPTPMHFWRKRWEALGQWNYDVYKAWWDPVRKQVEQGTAPPSFVRDVLLHPDTRYKGSNDEAMFVAMQLIEAGSDTTREALAIMVMAALENPAVFAKARAEIDRVCGVGEDARLPVLADMEDLRYICAMVKEVLRWRPVFPLMPEHTSDRDIEFEGYRFPKGTGFVINGIAVCKECEDPEAFMPERWMGDGHETDIAHGLWQFGGGRRLCVGYRLAQRSLFINVARLVQCIDYQAAGEYNPKDLNQHATDEPFPVKATARSAVYEKLILEQAQMAGVLEDAEWTRDHA